MDFEKAFDKVKHYILISKIKSYGINDPFLSRLNYFLINRSQIVKYKNYLSDSINVTTDVPQGDHMSSLLFSLFIND
jgi:hypothetical protein